MSKTNYFQSYGAVYTFLPRAVNDALTAPTDLLQQFIVAKVGQRLCRTWSLLNLGRSSDIADIFSGAAFIVRGYRCACEKIEAGLEEASCAKSFWSGGEDLRATL